MSPTFESSGISPLIENHENTYNVQDKTRHKKLFVSDTYAVSRGGVKLMSGKNVGTIKFDK
tara:strand:- start:36 stop:218 length:183 start_codon:yes stop_codon:yes gene_type:complete